MEETNEANRYHVTKVHLASTQQLENWANDPNCIEMEACAKELAERLAKIERRRVEHESAMAAQVQRLTERRQKLLDNPFDPRTEVSADAVHIASRIVKHLWIIFVLLPFVLALLLVIVGVIK